MYVRLDCIYALNYVLLLGDISMYNYKQNAHYQGLLLQQFIRFSTKKYKRSVLFGFSAATIGNWGN